MDLQAPEARGTMKLDFRVRRSSKPAETRQSSIRIFSSCASLFMFERLRFARGFNDRRTLDRNQCLVMNKFLLGYHELQVLTGFDRHGIHLPPCWPATTHLSTRAGERISHSPFQCRRSLVRAVAGGNHVAVD